MEAFVLILLEQPRELLKQLNRRDYRKYKKVVTALGKLQNDPRYPGLHTHPYEDAEGPEGEKIWQSYVENHTPGAWRIWWFYGPESGQITILLIGPHPD